MLRVCSRLSEEAAERIKALVATDEPGHGADTYDVDADPGGDDGELASHAQRSWCDESGIDVTEARSAGAVAAVGTYWARLGLGRHFAAIAGGHDAPIADAVLAMGGQPALRAPLQAGAARVGVLRRRHARRLSP